MTVEKIFTEKYVPLYRQLYGIAHALLGNADDAADAVQETMVKIWNMGTGLADVANPAGFAARILRTTAIDMLRRRRPTDDIGASSLQLSDPGLPDQDTDIEMIQTIINSLPAAQQTVIRLSAFDDRPPDEIADLTGFSPANVRQLLCRGRKRIKELYQKLMQQ